MIERTRLVDGSSRDEATDESYNSKSAGDLAVADDSVEAFRNRHGIPVSPSAKTSREWFWTFDVPVTATEIWPLLSDTSRLNRMLGLSRMAFREEGDRLIGSGRVAGLEHEWVEEPWEWIAPSTLKSRRRYRRGLFRSVLAIFEIRPIDRGSRIVVYFGWEPKGTLGSVTLRLGESSLRRRYERVIRGLASQSTEIEKAPPHSPLAADSRVELEARCQVLRNDAGSGPLVDRIEQYLVSAADWEVDRIQVRRLAREWAVDERDLLRVFLYATRAGLFELRWDVMCPHCRGVRSELESLSQIPEVDRCEICDVDFATDRETAIEVTFRIHSAVRHVPKVFYCSAEPAKKRHILLQQRLDAGVIRDMAFTLDPGEYRARVRGRDVTCKLIVTREGPRRPLWRASEVGDIELGTDARLRLENDTDTSHLFVIETLDWSDDALRVGQLFTMQEFRDLFSEQYIATGVHLAVGEQTVLFTDIVGSSDLYARSGDAEAFSRVREHFVRIGEIVRESRGAVVKTIGDATMAGFPTPADAVRAARGIQAAFSIPGDVALRTTVHSGPCIAVRLNSGIDYFGTTVNRASKLQHYARSGDVVLSQSLHEQICDRDEFSELQFEQRPTPSDSLEAGRPVYRLPCEH